MKTQAELNIIGNVTKNVSLLRQLHNLKLVAYKVQHCKKYY